MTEENNNNEDFLFGFSFTDSPEAPEQPPAPPAVDIDEYKDLIKKDVEGRLEEVEQLVLPLLANLKGNAEKDYIYWPADSRIPALQAQIEKIKEVITRGNA